MEGTENGVLFEVLLRILILMKGKGSGSDGSAVPQRKEPICRAHLAPTFLWYRWRTYLYNLLHSTSSLTTGLAALAYLGLQLVTRLQVSNNTYLGQEEASNNGPNASFICLFPEICPSISTRLLGPSLAGRLALKSSHTYQRIPYLPYTPKAACYTMQRNSTTSPAMARRLRSMGLEVGPDVRLFSCRAHPSTLSTILTDAISMSQRNHLFALQVVYSGAQVPTPGRPSSSEVIAVSTHAFDLGSALREPGVSCSTLTPYLILENLPLLRGFPPLTCDQGSDSSQHDKRCELRRTGRWPRGTNHGRRDGLTILLAPNSPWLLFPKAKRLALPRSTMIRSNLIDALAQHANFFRYPPAPGTWISAKQAHPAAVERHFFASSPTGLSWIRPASRQSPCCLHVLDNTAWASLCAYLLAAWPDGCQGEKFLMFCRTTYPSAAPQAFVTTSAIRQSPPHWSPPFPGLSPSLWSLRPGRDASPDLSTASCTQDHRSSSNVVRPLLCCESHSTAGPIPASAFFSTCAASERKTSTAPLVYHLAVYQLYTLASTTATSACPKPEIGEIIARHDDAAWEAVCFGDMSLINNEIAISQLSTTCCDIPSEGIVQRFPMNHLLGQLPMIVKPYALAREISQDPHQGLDAVKLPSPGSNHLPPWGFCRSPTRKLVFDRHTDHPEKCSRREMALGQLARVDGNLSVWRTKSTQLTDSFEGCCPKTFDAGLRFLESLKVCQTIGHDKLCFLRRVCAACVSLHYSSECRCGRQPDAGRIYTSSASQVPLSGVHSMEAFEALFASLGNRESGIRDGPALPRHVKLSEYLNVDGSWSGCGRGDGNGDQPSWGRMLKASRTRRSTVVVVWCTFRRRPPPTADLGIYFGTYGTEKETDAWRRCGVTHTHAHTYFTLTRLRAHSLTHSRYIFTIVVTFGWVAGGGKMRQQRKRVRREALTSFGRQASLW
ncbi:uncharacterized protein CLUP02_10018 [Colletotrichum lupini]|uniref:Uncharacterized protein n=1 Tax=Colletotrichum lupini TaxID=145971 RepID=A0A9Q8SXH5_9PEZI|nr:uncharacterized protein CLUP02_10018 [Colletotrichum lupini]UQC84521.1 hypothetical protein CLUP02_10018 [Colletotrichum lupini]